MSSQHRLISHEEKKIKLSWLLGEASYHVSTKLMGRVLTLIDASLPENKQTESLKALIRQEIYDCDSEVWKDVHLFVQSWDIPDDLSASGASASTVGPAPADSSIK